jgi:hypothetical protein
MVVAGSAETSMPLGNPSRRAGPPASPSRIPNGGQVAKDHGTKREQNLLLLPFFLGSYRSRATGRDQGRLFYEFG